MNRLRVYQLLGVPPAGLLITDARVTLWGKELSLDCVYNPDEPKHFRLTFQSCQEIHWQIFDQDVHGADEVDVIGIHIGQEAYRESATIHTDIFEINVFMKTNVAEGMVVSHIPLHSELR
jgi:hypothetical protein